MRRSASMMFASATQRFQPNVDMTIIQGHVTAGTYVFTMPLFSRPFLLHRLPSYSSRSQGRIFNVFKRTQSSLARSTWLVGCSRTGYSLSAL
ncbi:hypothetical protein ABKN59_003108 [Abortiporus biennis]